MWKTYFDTPYPFRYKIYDVYPSAPYPRAETLAVTLRDKKIADNYSNKGYAAKLGTQNMTSKRTLNAFRVKDSVPMSYLVLGRRKIAPADPVRSCGVTGFPLSGLTYPLNHLSFSPTLINNTASARIYSKIHDAHTSVSGGVLLGELRETLSMLKHPLKGMRLGLQSYLDEIKRLKKLNRGVITPKMVSDTWLEYKFGWLPLISDTQDIIEAIDRISKKAQRPIRLKASEHFETSSNSSFVLTKAGDVLIKSTSLTKTSYGVYYNVGLLPQTDLAVDASRELGLTLNEFVPTVWELLPWSFVVDYFTNVGDILAASFTVTDQIAYVSRSRVTSTIAKATFRGDGIWNTNVVGFGIQENVQGSVTYERKDIERDAILSPPTLVLSNANLSQWVNLSALYVSLLTLNQKRP